MPPPCRFEPQAALLLNGRKEIWLRGFRVSRRNIFRNRRRMRYPKFHALGYCTSTGVLEAGCKVAIGTRLKRPGMHWTVSGANAIIALRCCKLSGRYEDFFERRSSQFNAAA